MLNRSTKISSFQHSWFNSVTPIYTLKILWYVLWVISWVQLSNQTRYSRVFLELYEDLIDPLSHTRAQEKCLQQTNNTKVSLAQTARGNPVRLEGWNGLSTMCRVMVGYGVAEISCRGGHVGRGVSDRGPKASHALGGQKACSHKTCLKFKKPVGHGFNSTRTSTWNAAFTGAAAFWPILGQPVPGGCNGDDRGKVSQRSLQPAKNKKINKCGHLTTQ